MNTPKKMPNSPQPTSQSGFTIIESLIAILVVTILMVGLAPVVALSVATRVQAKRVEQATQAARSYVDGVRAGGILSPPMTASDLKSYAPPSPGALTCPRANDYCTSTAAASTDVVSSTSLYCFDVDGDGKCTNTSNKDLIVQGFGQIPNSGGTATNAKFGYRNYILGVRVYRADAFAYSSSFSAGKAQTAYNGGTGLSKNQAPLVEMTTEMTVTDPTKFKNLCDKASPAVTGC